MSPLKLLLKISSTWFVNPLIYSSDLQISKVGTTNRVRLERRPVASTAGGQPTELWLSPHYAAYMVDEKAHVVAACPRHDMT